MTCRVQANRQSAGKLRSAVCGMNERFVIGGKAAAPVVAANGSRLAPAEAGKQTRFMCCKAYISAISMSSLPTRMSSWALPRTERRLGAKG